MERVDVTPSKSGRGLEEQESVHNERVRQNTGEKTTGYD